MFAALLVCATMVAPAEKPFKPTAVFRGSHSQIQKERIVQVLAADGWKELWKDHRGRNTRFTETEQEIEVDFETHYVIAIFTGRNWDWCEITPRQRESEVVIGFHAEGYQTEGGPLGGGDPTPAEIEQRKKEESKAPYAFIVLPRSVRHVAIEQDVRRTLQPPAVWKHRTRFTLKAK